MLKVEKRYFSRVTPLLGIGRKDFNFSPFKAEAQPFLALKGGPKLADTRKSMKLANVDRRIIAEDYRTSTWDPIGTNLTYSLYSRSAKFGIKFFRNRPQNDCHFLLTHCTVTSFYSFDLLFSLFPLETQKYNG